MTERADLLLGDQMLAEYCERLLGSKFDLLIPRAQRLLFLNRFIAAARVIADPPHVRVCRDPEDDMVLALAIGGHADAVVTGDKDLLSLTPFRGVPIVTPRAFLEMVRERNR